MHERLKWPPWKGVRPSDVTEFATGINTSMNYIVHYNNLIEKARTRVLTEYSEKHHVIPVCLGGSNDSDNIVSLTPEEHYIAHQLLTKIHPDHGGLVWAAIMMTHNSPTHSRSNNKMYGWLRRKYQKVAKTRTGSSNGSFGRPWYHDPDTLKSGKFVIGSEPSGWQRGRIPPRPVPPKRKKRVVKGPPACIICNIRLESPHSNYCDTHRKEAWSKASKGRSLSEEHKQKISKSHMGKTVVISQETRDKWSRTHKERLKDKRNHSQYGTIWINNGIVCKHHDPALDIPNGWKKGKRLNG